MNFQVLARTSVRHNKKKLQFNAPSNIHEMIMNTYIHYRQNNRYNWVTFKHEVEQ